MGIRLITPATLDPITVSEVRAQCRITHHHEDPLILDQIRAATNLVERETGRQLIAATWELSLDAWPATNAPVYLERPPLLSVTQLQFVESFSGLTITMDPSAYRVDIHSDPGTVSPAYGTSWPAARRQPGAITIRYVAGYGSTPPTIPPLLRDAIRQLAAARYEYREAISADGAATVPMGAERALELYRDRFDYRANLPLDQRRRPFLAGQGVA